MLLANAGGFGILSVGAAVTPRLMMFRRLVLFCVIIARLAS